MYLQQPPGPLWINYTILFNLIILLSETVCVHTFCIWLHCFDMVLCPYLRMKAASSLSWSPMRFSTRNTCFPVLFVMSCEVLQQLSQVTPAPEHLQLHIVMKEFVGMVNYWWDCPWHGDIKAVPNTVPLSTIKSRSWIWDVVCCSLHLRCLW